MNTLRSTFIKRGLIRPCVPTPLVKDDAGRWTIGVTRYEK